MNELRPGEESLRVGVRRVASAEVDHAIRAIDAGPDPHTAVHEVRKSCKKIRAALRLVRDAVGPDCYHRENAHFRDAARRIADLRDRQVAIETFDSVGDELPLSDLHRERIRDALTRRRDEVVEETARTLELDRVAVRLRDGQARIHHWPIPDDGFETIREGLHRVYRRGYERGRRACRTRNTRDLHDWRKRAKYLRYQVRMLRPLWPGSMRALASTLHELTDALGADHDLAVLFDTIVDLELARLDTVEGQRLEARLGEIRSRHQGEARRVGERVYAEKPARFVNRVGGYWGAGSA